MRPTANPTTKRPFLPTLARAAERALRCAAGLACGLTLTVVVPAPLKAATIQVDGTVCTLADAIVAANTDLPSGGCAQGDAGADILELDADVTLTAADATATIYDGVGAGLPDVTDDLTIRAGLANVIRRDASFSCDAMTADPVFRFLNLESGILKLENLRFEDGCFVAGGSADGGGIRSAASTELELSGVTISNYGAFTTSSFIRGGFLYTVGDRLTLTDVVFDGLTIQAVGSVQGGVLRADDTKTVQTLQGTSFRNLDISSSGGSVQGGTIYSRGQVTVDDSLLELIQVATNSSSIQGGAIYIADFTGPLTIRETDLRQIDAHSDTSSLQGGALYSGIGVDVELDGVSFSDFEMSAGGSCQGGAFRTNGDGPYQRLRVENITCTAGSSVNGTGAWLSGLLDSIVMRDCLFRNLVGRAGAGSRGGALQGGGFQVIERCAFIDNELTVMSPTEFADAEGGALFASRASTLHNVTFVRNVARGGEGENSDGGSALGGALHLGGVASTSTLSSVTFSDNQAMAGPGSAGFSDGPVHGGGLYVASNPAAELVNSILAGNQILDSAGVSTDEDCFASGTFNSLGYNLVQSPDASCVVTSTGDVTGTDPALYAPADYGCMTTLPGGSCMPAAAIDQSSPAADAGSCAAASVTEDARETLRPFDLVAVGDADDGCDIGAFEAVDGDGDGITEAADCDDSNPGVSMLDRCGVCGGDGSGCLGVAPIGDAFQVNEQTTGDQYAPVVRGLSTGGFVVAWNDALDVAARFFDAGGMPTTSQLDVSGVLTGDHTNAEISVASDDSSVIVWERPSNRIAGRRFASDGTVLGADFQIRESSAITSSPVVSHASDGGFQVAWIEPVLDDVKGDLYDSAAGIVNDDETLVNRSGDGTIEAPSLAASGVRFLLTWDEDFSFDGDGLGVGGQLVAVEGTPSGSPFQVNGYTTGDQSLSRVATDPAGDFVVVWQSEGQDGDGSGVIARRFDSAGQAAGDEMVVNLETSGDQDNADLAFAADSSGLVVFEDGASALRGRFLGTGGSLEGESSLGGDGDGDGDTGEPRVASAGDGFVVVWTDSSNLDGDGRGIFARFYGIDVDGDGVAAAEDCDDADSAAQDVDTCGVCGGDNSSCAIFVDGFESGDVSAWSSSTGG